MEKINYLIEIVESNEQLMKVFEVLDEISLTQYYVGAGAIAQSIWNKVTDKHQNYGISDIDIVYYNSDNLTEDEEKRIAEEIKERIPEMPLKVDVKNEARVHLWYKEKFGYDIEPYKSLEDAINSWPTTATSLGIRREDPNKWVVYAPFGIDDIFDLKVVANCRQITEEIFIQKVKKWTGKWEELSVEKWTGDIIPIVHPEAIRIKTFNDMKSKEQYLMKGPDKKKLYPIETIKTVCYISNLPKRPNIEIGEYTYYSDNKNSPEKFYDNIEYHYEFLGDKLIIGKFCAIAEGVKFIMNGANHRMDGITTYPFNIFGGGWERITPRVDQLPFKGDTVIGNDVWIGQNVTIMPGVKIGDGGIIAANSTVVKNVEPYTIYGGNPAKFIKKRFSDEKIEFLLKLQWWNWEEEKIFNNLERLTSETGLNQLMNKSLDSGPFYHGTKADLKVGDLLEPGYSSNYGEGKKANFVYLTATLGAAIWGAELAIGEKPGRIYQVEPIGSIEDDPNLTDKKFPGNPTRSYRSRQPLRVVGEVLDWEGHPLEELQKMQNHLNELKRLGIEAIND